MYTSYSKLISNVMSQYFSSFFLQVKRIQNLVEATDVLKAKYNNPFMDQGRYVEAKTQTHWATFDSGLGQAPQPHAPQPSTQITENWERFD